MRVGVIFDNRISVLDPRLYLPENFFDQNPSEKGRMQIFIYLNSDSRFQIERFKAFKKYDVVIFVKSFSGECVKLAEKLQSRGTKIIFDINVNYYERWGDYSGVRQYQWVTDEQMENCKRMTTLADHVVARSTYLENICRKYNKNVTWVTDPVDTDMYRPAC